MRTPGLADDPAPAPCRCGAGPAPERRFARRRDRAGARLLVTASVLYVPALLVSLMLDRL